MGATASRIGRVFGSTVRKSLYIQPMDYFASNTSSLAHLGELTRVSIESKWAELEGRVGKTLAHFDLGGIDVAKKRVEHAQARQREAEEELGRQRSLAQIVRRATQDATQAWERGDPVFAPVLFQPLMRVECGWEAATSEISRVGWTLDSWQIIGPAPDPFNFTVTLIQTLFKR